MTIIPDSIFRRLMELILPRRHLTKIVQGRLPKNKSTKARMTEQSLTIYKSVYTEVVKKLQYASLDYNCNIRDYVSPDIFDDICQKSLLPTEIIYGFVYQKMKYYKNSLV